MYSRKFNQSSIPPDYSGISFRQKAEEELSPQPIENTESCTKEPRYPLEDRRQAPPRRFKFRPVPEKKPSSPQTKNEANEKERPLQPVKTQGALLGHSFTMEDIVLAGLILLLLNSDCDTELLLVLGFLLLVGLQ